MLTVNFFLAVHGVQQVCSQKTHYLYVELVYMNRE